MPRRRYVLTPELQQSIVSFVTAGGFPHVAAEAAGIPRRVFAQWLQRGEGAEASSIYGELARAVRTAHAQARLQTEIAMRNDKPLEWLKCGPGKETADAPGWTAAVRARPPEVDAPDRDQLRGELFALLGRFVEHLDAPPEQRAELAAWLIEQRRRGESKMAPNGTN